MQRYFANFFVLSTALNAGLTNVTTHSFLSLSTTIRQHDSGKKRKKKVVDSDDDSENDADEPAMDIVKDDDDQSGNDDDEDQESSSDTTSGDEESEAEPDPPPRKRKSPGGKPAKAVPARKIRVQQSPKTNNKSNTAKNTRKNAATGGSASGSAPTFRAVHTALTALAKKVLDPSETPETSLVAALLASYKPADGSAAATKKGRRTKSNTNKETLYTAQLEKIAHSVIQDHGSDPNQTQVALFNLLFRSVGGTVATNLNATEIELEAVSEEEWMELVTSIVKEMQTTSTDRTLLCADPSGAAHAAATKSGTGNTTTPKSHSVGAREYRKIYEEFWYLLGKVALTGSVNVPPKTKDDDDDSDNEDSDDEDSDDKVKAPPDNSRFQVELARDLVARLIEMVGVGQPDIRAAATTAVYQLGTAMLERTVELNAKLTVATRQLNVAKRGKQSRKAEALSGQVDSWKRTVADLEEMVKDTILGIFMNRYRDSNMHIRADSLKALGTYTLMRPDLFLVGSYLKYFGWLLSDKETCVRQQAVLGFLGPFREVANAKAGKRETSSPMDMNNAKTVIVKFLPRLADCAIDVDFQVQERAMELLLVLMREDFLDALDDDDIWEQINLQALARDTTPAVRRDALYFIIDQLEAFDSGPAKTEAKMVERIDGIAQW
jgi:cohesin complex subunit SA-1/2